MEESIRSWRKRAALVGRVGRGGRYPAEMRTEAVELCRGALASGGSVNTVAAALGVAASTLWTWRSRASSAEVGRLVPVALVEARSTTSMVSVRVGAAEASVSVEQLAELIRRLS